MHNRFDCRSIVLRAALLLLIVILSLLPLGCQQGGTVEGVVYHKMVTGRIEERIYTIIVRNELTKNGDLSIVIGAEEEEIRACFPSEGNLVVDDMSERQIEAFYTRIDYNVSIHVMSGNRYKYYRGCRTDRETFNQLIVGTKVKLETKPTTKGPWIVSIIESTDSDAPT